MAELEKLGRKYRVALRIAKDPRFKRLGCLHKGTYADDCLVERIQQHQCYIVATCDRDLKRRIRKTPGVPIMYISQRKFTVERMPDAFGGKSPTASADGCVCSENLRAVESGRATPRQRRSLHVHHPHRTATLLTLFLQHPSDVSPTVRRRYNRDLMCGYLSTLCSSTPDTHQGQP